jgi:hypothetical protein
MLLALLVASILTAPGESPSFGPADAVVHDHFRTSDLRLAGSGGALRARLGWLEVALGPRYELAAPALAARLSFVLGEGPLTVLLEASWGRSLVHPVAEAARVVHWSFHGERLDPVRYAQVYVTIGVQWRAAPGVRFLLGVEQRRLWTPDGKLPTLVRTSEADALSAQATLRGLFTATGALLVNL